MKMTRCVVMALLLWATQAATPVRSAPHVLVIGVDGLRVDAMEAASTPNIDALIANGTYSSNATTSALSFSGSGWTDILNGIHWDQHNVTTNATSDNPDEADPQYQTFSGSNQYQFPDFMAIANTANPALQTARFTGAWNPIHTTRTPAGSEYTFLGSDAAAAADAANFYANNDADVGFIYFADPDVAGHAHGFHPSRAGYTNQISTTDALIGSVVTAIQNRPNYASEDWLFVLASDHGGDSSGDHGSNWVWQRQVPLIVSGAAAVNQVFPYGAKNVDVAPTVLTHLGVPLPGHLVGRPVGFSTPQLPDTVLDSNLIFNGDAEFDRGFAATLYFDQAITGWNEYPDADFLAETANYRGEDSPTVLRYGSDASFPASGQGSNFFASGGNVTTTMTQDIDVTLLSSTIDGGINFQLDAYLGGDSGSDHADLTIEWFDGNDVSLGSWIMNGEVAAGGLVLNRRGDVVPVGARQATLTLTLFGEGVYADDLSLILTANAVVNTTTIRGDLDGDFDIDGADWLLYVAGLGSATPGDTDLTGDGLNNHADFVQFKQLYEDFNGLGSFQSLFARVPEPSSVGLLGLAVALLCGKRYRDIRRRGILRSLAEEKRGRSQSRSARDLRRTSEVIYTV